MSHSLQIRKIEVKGQSVDNLSERAQGDGRCLYILLSKQTDELQAGHE